MPEITPAARCGICNRALTDPASVNRGVGPVCAGRLVREPLLPFPNFLAAAAKATAAHVAKRVRKAKARPARPAPIRWRYWSA